MAIPPARHNTAGWSKGKREGSYRSKVQVWYGSPRWKAIRAAQIAKEPLCAMCKARNKIKAANIADHVTPHRGDEALFWYGRLQSLCKQCHDSDKQAIEAGGKAKPTFSVDGWPIEA